jgi:curved DNA-binding protein CbpA
MRLSDLLAVSGLPEDATLQAVYSLALGGYLKRNEWRSAFLLSLPENPAATATEDAAPMDAEAEEAARAKRELDSFFARMEVAQTFYDMLGVEKDVSNKSLKDIYYKLARRFHPDLFRGAEPSLRARVETEFARATRAYETLKDEAQRAKYDTKLAAQEASAILSGNKPQPPKPAPPPPPEVNPREPATEVKPPVSAPGQPINFTPPVVRPVRPTPPAPDANPVAPFLARDDNRRDAFQMPAKQDSFQMPLGRASTPQKVDLMMQNRAADQFQRGLAALASRDHIAAVACLAEAVRLDPTKARYHAYFGRALSNNAGARRQAEAELQEAIHLEPHNLDYYVMMAEFYWNAGFRLRAKGEIKRILEKDPFHPDARTLRDKLNAETLKK